MPRPGSASRPAGDRQSAALAKQRKNEKKQQKVRSKTQESRLLQSLGKKRASSGRDTDEFRNEVDSFMDQRDIVNLGDEAPAHNDDDFDEEAGEVLALPEEDSEDYDDEDEDGDGRQWLEEEAEEKAQHQRSRAIADEEATSKRWGKRRSAYYDADTRDYEIQSDDEAAVAEEKEAIRLVKERAAQLQDQDFESEAMLGALIKKKAAGKKTAQVTAVDEEPAITTEVEVVAKDLSKLTKEQKLQMIAADSPELIALLSEFKSTLADLQGDLAAIDKLHEQSQSAGDLAAKLQHKFQLQLNYCINIAFYLYLKAEGHPVKNHPVIERLMRVRTLLSAFEPTGKKLTRQLEALFKSAGSAEVSQPEATEESDSAEPVRSGTKKKQSSTMSALASLRAELAAESAEDSKAIDSTMDAAEKAALEAEEKQFAKLLEKKRKKPSKSTNPSFSEFGDISASKGEDIAAASDLNFDELLGKKGTKPAVVGEKRKKAAPASAADDDDDDFGAEDFEAGAAMYAAAEQQAKKKRKAKEEQYAPPAKLLAEDDPDQVDDSGRRGATNSMIKNKGLTRYRPRDQKTPRVRQRKRFERAQKKRRSQVQEYKGKTDSYGGEQTGIKTHVVKSRSLRV